MTGLRRAMRALAFLLGAMGAGVLGGFVPAHAAEPAQRIVSIGGAITEIAYALGQQDRLVGVDATSLFPREAMAKPNVGYLRALSAEGVLALRPDLILAVEGSGPPGVIDILRDASVPLVMVPDGRSIAGLDRKIEIVADALGVPAEGHALAARVHAEMEAAVALTDRVKVRRRVLFILGLSDGRPMGGGQDTAADAIIRLAGAENALQGISGYKPVSAEAIAATAPDVILMMRRAGADEPTPEEVFESPALKFTPAAKTRTLLVMDGLYLLGFGPRTAFAVRDLAGQLYPDIDVSADHARR